MPVQAVGSPPPEADQLRTEIESQLPSIIARFSEVLQKEFGFENLKVDGFTIVTNY